MRRSVINQQTYQANKPTKQPGIQQESKPTKQPGIQQESKPTKQPGIQQASGSGKQPGIQQESRSGKLFGIQQESRSGKLFGIQQESRSGKLPGTQQANSQANSQANVLSFSKQDSKQDNGQIEFSLNVSGDVTAEPLVYQIILRGYKGAVIFRRDKDYRRFLFLLNRIIKKQSANLYGYALMTNHIHLLIKTSTAKIIANQIIKQYSGYYALTRKGNEYRGKLFDSPNFSVNFSNGSQINELMYILNNPPVAHLSSSFYNYPYNSYKFYTKRKPNYAYLIDVDASLVKRNYKTLDSFKADLEIDLNKRLSMKKFKKSRNLRYDNWNGFKM
jgi:REP element-mobilizing transposase RayT